VDEVRFDRMVPSEVVARREACNLAYLPVGSLEWHGPHMPFGTDYMTVNYLAEQAAGRFGGVAFPPVYYGDVRYILQECRREWRKSYMREMAVPEANPSAFPLQNNDGSYGYECPTPPDDGPPADVPLDFTKLGMEQVFSMQIAQILLSIHLYGFRRIILLPGHGPNPAYCKRAEEIYPANVRRRTAWGPPAETMTWFYLDAAKQSEPLLKNHWIHADKFEGSLTMVAAPGTVHLDKLPEDPKALVPAYLGHPYIHEDQGYNPEHKAIWHSFNALDPRNDTNADYGRRQWDAILDVFGRAIAEMRSDA